MIGGFIGKPIGGAMGDAGIAGTLSKTLDDAALSAAGAVALKAALSKTLDDAALSATGVIALKGAAAITLADATLAATGAVAIKGTLSATLADATLSSSGAIALKASLSVTLDDLITSLTGSPLTTITDTEVLQLPVDCVLAGQQVEYRRRRTFEPSRGRGGERVRVAAGARGRLGGPGPGFTVRTDSRGYD